MGFWEIGLAIAGFAGGVTFYRPLLGLWLILTGNIVDIPLTLGMTVYTNEFLLAGVALGFLARLITAKHREMLDWRLLAAMLPWLGFVVLSGIHAEFFSSTLKQTLRWMELLLVVGLAAHAVKDKNQLQQTMAVLVLMGCVAAGVGIVQSMFGLRLGLGADNPLYVLSEGSTLRAYSTFGHPNQFAGYLVTVIPLAFIQTIEGSTPRARWLFGSATVLLMTALVLTFSRGGWVAIAVVGAVLVYLNVPKKLRLIGGILVGLLLMIALMHQGSLRPTQQAVFDRVTSFSQPQKEDSVSFRRVCYATALEMFRRSPWLGFGAGNYLRNIRRHFNESYYAWEAIKMHIHNLYLQIVIETGLLGLAGFIFFIGYVFRRTVWAYLRTPRSDWTQWLSGLLAAGVAFLIHNLFDVLTITVRGIHFGVVLGLSLAAANLIQKQADEQ